MLRLAKDVLSNCKKMQALVTRSDLPYKDINYTPSGTNYEDYVKWCLSAMYNAEQNNEKAKTTTTGNISNKDNSNDNEDDNLEDVSPEDVPYPSNGKTNIVDNLEVLEVPKNYFFKGFLAWCLWGWIPILPGSSMKSFLFSDAKCNTSFGRKIASRRAMKSNSTSAAYDDVERSPKKQKQQRGQEQMKMDSVANQQHTNVLEKTYKLFEAELIEKELQNTHHLELRIIRDNLASLNKRHDRLLERYYRTQNGPAQLRLRIIWIDTKTRFLNWKQV
ncbi:hypothetical protein MHU86_2971 [Fragilaria crotonensis]|nr:hypothetical protein MHU86_2971 [Fragilaria crotonensis]